MVTNQSYPIASHPEATSTGATSEGVGGRKVIDRLRQVVCALHGHDSLVQFEQDRMFLRCVSCGHETPGWELSEPSRAAAASSEPTPERRMTQAELMRERRIA